MPNLLVRVGTMSRALSWWVLPKCMDRCQLADDSYLMCATCEHVVWVVLANEG